MKNMRFRLPADMLDEPEDYKPGRVEKAIVDFLQAEYIEAQAICSAHCAKMAQNTLARSGRFVRNENDTSPLAKLYVPWIAQHHRVKVALDLLRLIPDFQTCDFFNIRVATAIPPEQDEQLGIQLGLDPGVSASEEIGRILTVALRGELRRSNLRSAMKRAESYRRGYGTALSTVEPALRSLPMPSDDIGTPVVRDGEIEMRQSMEERVMYDGLNFTTIFPGNILVGDTKCDGGISALPWVTIYQRKSFRALLAREMKLERGKRVSGVYANLKYLNFRKQKDQSDILPAAESASGLNASSVNGDAQARSCYTFEVPLRIGKFRLEDVTELVENPPTDAEMAEFRKVFGIYDDELLAERDYRIEWDVASGVLLRFEPDRGLVIPGQQHGLVETRHIVSDGETFGGSDYTICGNVEILANNALQDLLEMADRGARPMYGIRRGQIEKKWQEAVGNGFTFVPDGLIPLGNSTGAKFLETIEMTGDPKAAQLAIQTCLDIIRRTTGVSPQIEGGEGSAESATESVQQQNYLEQQLRAEQDDMENDLLIPLLKRALAILIEVILDNGEFQAIATNRDLELWGEKYRDVPWAQVFVTPEMVVHGYEIEITTTGAGGDRQARMTRLERLGQMGAQYGQLLAASGKTFAWPAFFSKYTELLDLSPNEFILPAQENPAAAAMALTGGESQQGGNPGGAGTPRPNYERPQVNEMSAPGEAVTSAAPSVAHQLAVSGAVQ